MSRYRVNAAIQPWGNKSYTRIPLQAEGSEREARHYESRLHTSR